MVNQPVPLFAAASAGMKRLCDGGPTPHDVEHRVNALKYSVGTVMMHQRLTLPTYRQPTASSLPVRQCNGDSHHLRLMYENIFVSVAGTRDMTSRPCDASLLYGLNMLHLVVSEEAHPSNTLIAYLLHQVIMVRDNVQVLRRCTSLLRVLLELHPPHSRRLRTLYYEALTGTRDTGWSLILSAVDRSLTSDPTDPAHMTRLQFVDWLVDLLEQDMAAWAAQCDSRHSSLQCQSTWPLVARVVWQDVLSVASGRRTSALFSLLVTAHAQNAPPSVTLALHRLLAMMAECVRLTSPVTCMETTQKMRQMAADCGRTLLDHIADLSDDTVENFLCLLRPKWLLVHVCAALLERRYGRPTTSNITMAFIVTSYLEAEPDFSCLPLSLPAASSQTDSESPISSPFKRPVSVLGSPVKPLPAQLTRKNRAGDTPLHVMCAENRWTQLNQALQTAGLHHVNVLNRAGRSPLHVACSNGHRECARALLQHRPQGLHRYFSPSKKSSATAASGDGGDVRLLSADGLSPFHEAIVGGRVSIVQLLLDWAGPALLQHCTGDGRTPISLAVDQTMRCALLKAEPGGIEGATCGGGQQSLTGGSVESAVCAVSRCRKQYTVLVFHLTTAHSCWLQLLDVRRQLLGLYRASTASVALPPAVSCQLSDQLLLNYNRQLRQLQDSLRPAARGAVAWMHRRFGRYLILLLKE